MRTAKQQIPVLSAFLNIFDFCQIGILFCWRSSKILLHRRRNKEHFLEYLRMLWTSVLWPPLGSLNTHVFETRTTTGRGHFACQDSGVSPIFIPSISNGEKILGNVNAVVRRQVIRENSSLPVAVRISKTCVLKLPIDSARTEPVNEV